MDSRIALSPLSVAVVIARCVTAASQATAAARALGACRAGAGGPPRGRLDPTIRTAGRRAAGVSVVCCFAGCPERFSTGSGLAADTLASQTMGEVPRLPLPNARQVRGLGSQSSRACSDGLRCIPQAARVSCAATGIAILYGCCVCQCVRLCWSAIVHAVWPSPQVCNNEKCFYDLRSPEWYWRLLFNLLCCDDVCDFSRPLSLRAGYMDWGTLERDACCYAMVFVATHVSSCAQRWVVEPGVQADTARGCPGVVH